MKKTLVILLLIISCFGFDCRIDETISNQQVKNSNEVEYYTVLANPESYKSKVLQIKAIIRGYHGYVLYNENCCAVEKVVNAQGIDYEMRRKMAEKINEIYAGNAKSDFSGELTVLGKLEDNDIKPIYPSEIMPKYKFTIQEIKDYQPNQSFIQNSCLSQLTAPLK